MIKIDINKTPPSEKEIKAEQGSLKAKAEKIRAKSGGIILIIFLVIIGILLEWKHDLIVPVKADSWLWTMIGVFLGCFILGAYAKNLLGESVRIEYLIKSLHKLNPTLQKFEKIEKVTFKFPEVKQYVQTALNQRGFLIEAEYTKIMAYRSEGALKNIYMRLKGEKSNETD